MSLVTLTPRVAREQVTFRTLLNAMSRPGTTGQIEPHETGGDFAAAVTLLESLLDHEVTFAVAPGMAGIDDALLRLTGSRLDAIERADYLLTNSASLTEVLASVKDGSFEYPDRSATVVCLVDSLESGRAYRLNGPGIRDTKTVRIAGLSADAIAAFAERNAARPLGVDLVLVTANGRVVCLPRYTNVSPEEE